jgi:preprotein translocase subunit SecG
LVSLILILIVLLQTGKGAALGAAFGGASQTIFGSRGPGGFLGKLTTAAAIIFMLTSLILAFVASGPRTLVFPEPPSAFEEGAPSSPFEGSSPFEQGSPFGESTPFEGSTHEDR